MSLSKAEHNIHSFGSGINIPVNKDLFLSKSDKEIWNEFKGGSESAFIFIYDTYFNSLLGYGLNFCPDREFVLDCLQDMFIELREKCRTVTKTDTIKPMLFKIFRRRINHYIRKFRDELERRESIVKRDFGFCISPEQHLIEKQLTQDQIKLLNQAINLLSVKEREAIYHYYYEDLSYAQIAVVMGYSQIKTARTLVYKALKSLRAVLSKEQKKIFLYFMCM